jgi:hypothetical protein
LQIEENSGMDFELSGKLTNRRDATGVVLLRPVRRIESKDIDSRFEQLPEYAFGIS